MSTIRQRLGNVIAWVGFAALIFGVLPLTTLFLASVWEEMIQEQPKIFILPCEKIDETLTNFSDLVDAGFDADRCPASREVGYLRYKGVVGGATYRGQANFFYGYDDKISEHSVKEKLAAKGVGYSYRTWSRLYSYFFEPTAALSSLWVLCLILNYIFYGSARVLPWKPLRGDG